MFAAVSFFTHHRLLVATSMTDALTGIPNRRKLKLDLEERLREAGPAAADAVRPQRVQGYNDTFGHPAGDALLVRLAKALEAP